jgi:hypothetical protein|tara:strand:- start:236 stop:865 length:630 start_codon:yes stop_codon:yes gene_type:complete
MAESLDSLYVNLKILSGVKSYNRISTKQEYFEIVGPTQSSLVPLCLQRWYAGENRQDAIVKIQELYMSAADVLNSSSIKLAEKTRLREHLMASLNGLIALQKTYEGDPTTIAKLEVICDTAKCILKGETVYNKLTRIRNGTRLGFADGVVDLKAWPIDQGSVGDQHRTSEDMGSHMEMERSSSDDLPTRPSPPPRKLITSNRDHFPTRI